MNIETKREEFDPVKEEIITEEEKEEPKENPPKKEEEKKSTTESSKTTTKPRPTTTNDPKICVELQKNLNSQSNLDRTEQSLRHPHFLISNYITSL